jgi:hypothetical protein
MKYFTIEELTRSTTATAKSRKRKKKQVIHKGKA